MARFVGFVSLLGLVETILRNLCCAIALTMKNL